MLFWHVFLISQEKLVTQPCTGTWFGEISPGFILDELKVLGIKNNYLTPLGICLDSLRVFTVTYYCTIIRRQPYTIIIVNLIYIYIYIYIYTYVCMYVIHDTQSTQISQKQDGHMLASNDIIVLNQNIQDFLVVHQLYLKLSHFFDYPRAQLTLIKLITLQFLSELPKKFFKTSILFKNSFSVLFRESLEL